MRLTLFPLLFALPFASAASQEPPKPGDAGQSSSRSDTALPPLETEQVTPAPGGTTQAMADIEAYLRGLESLRADFVQRGPDGSVANGVLKIHRPGRLRFDYTDGTPLLLVSDGETLTFIDYEVGQVTRWPIDETPLGLLVKKDPDLDNSNLNIEVSAGAMPGYWTVTASDPKDELNGKVTLTFARQENHGLRLLGWEILDAQGYETRIALQALERDVDFPPETWTFEDPRQLPAKRRRRGR